MDDDQRLNDLRNEIDEIDAEIQALIERRGRQVLEIARLKAGTQGAASYYRPEREAQVLERIKRRNQGPLSAATVARLFREIMSACLALESPLRIAYLGPEGTYTQNAAVKHFGHAVETLPLTTIDEVFREVEAGNAAFGVVPVENSTEGVVNHTLDRLPESPLRICGEVDLLIQHHLLGNVASLDEVTRVLSHQQSLAQCRDWLARNLPGRELVAVSSNAEAARRASSEPGVAAIAGATAAELYGLGKLASNIEDHPGNTTRFLVIGDIDVAPSGNDKTSVVVSSRNQPGALHTLLTPLAKHNISMSRIESRPSRKALWEYVFFIDLDGHMQDPGVAKVLRAWEKDTAYLKLLGSYPKAVL